MRFHQSVSLALGFVLCLACKPRVANEFRLAGSAAEGQANWVQRMGLTVEEADGALRVRSVEKVSPGCVMGLEPQDRILALNGVATPSVEAFDKVAWANVRGPFRPWCLTVERNGRTYRFPYDCRFKELRRDPKARNYVCDPLNMRICGPLTERCQDD